MRRRRFLEEAMKPSRWTPWVLLLALGSAGCASDLAKQNATTMIMEIGSIRSSAGVQFIISDVRLTTGTVVNDNAIVEVNIFRKNPNVSSTSALEHILLQRYEIRYFRSDGQNVEGVDVPYRISGPLNDRLHTPTGTGEIAQSVTVIAVTHQAKLEPPLRNLQGLIALPPAGTAPSFISGAGVLTVFAEITIHGVQIGTGDAISASGRIPIVFADFGD